MTEADRGAETTDANSDENRAMRAPFERWLAQKWDADVEVLSFESPEPPVYPVQAPGLDVEIEIQYRVMQALHAAGGIPLAPLLGYEASTEILGSPFFVMRHVAGEVAREHPASTPRRVSSSTHRRTRAAG